MKKLLLNNQEAERALLGAIFLNPDSICAASEAGVVEDTFSVKNNGLIFTAMQVVIDSKGEADPAALHAELDKAGNYEKVGGVVYLEQLIGACNAASNAPHLARLVVECARRRTLRTKMQGLLAAFDEDTRKAQAIANDAVVELSAFVISNDRGDLADMHVAFKEWAEARESAKRDGLVATGWLDLDDLLNGGGFRPGQFIVPAGRTSVGKTTFAFNIALHAASLGKRVAFFSFEMDRAELFNKALLTHHGPHLEQAIANGTFADSAGKLVELPLWTDPTGPATVAEIAGKCRRRMAALGGLDLVVIDYLQMIATKRRKGGTRTEELGEVTRALKAMAKELRVPIISPAQLNRAAAGDTPTLSHLRESGSIEQDADIVLLLYKKDELSNQVMCKIAKQRNGRTETVELTFRYEYQQLESAAKPSAQGEI